MMPQVEEHDVSFRNLTPITLLAMMPKYQANDGCRVILINHVHSHVYKLEQESVFCGKGSPPELHN